LITHAVNAISGQATDIFSNSLLCVESVYLGEDTTIAKNNNFLVQSLISSTNFVTRS